MCEFFEEQFLTCLPWFVELIESRIIESISDTLSVPQFLDSLFATVAASVYDQKNLILGNWRGVRGQLSMHLAAHKQGDITRAAQRRSEVHAYLGRNDSGYFVSHHFADLDGGTLIYISKEVEWSSRRMQMLHGPLKCHSLMQPRTPFFTCCWVEGSRPFLHLALNEVSLMHFSLPRIPASLFSKVQRLDIRILWLFIVTERSMNHWQLLPQKSLLTKEELAELTSWTFSFNRRVNSFPSLPVLPGGILTGTLYHHFLHVPRVL
jgi:hypothetical protein